MAPKKKPVAEIGGVQVRNGRFRARVHACTGHRHGPTRSTKEEALADLNAARTGATDKEDVARHLAELAAAATGLTASRRSESTLPSSSSVTSADAHEPQDVAEWLLARPAAEQSHARGHASVDDQQNDYPALFRILLQIFCRRCVGAGACCGQATHAKTIHCSSVAELLRDATSVCIVSDAL